MKILLLLMIVSLSLAAEGLKEKKTAPVYYLPLADSIPFYKKIPVNPQKKPDLFIRIFDTLQFLDSTNGWCKVRTKTSQVGYVKSMFLLSLRDLQIFAMTDRMEFARAPKTDPEEEILKQKIYERARKVEKLKNDDRSISGLDDVLGNIAGISRAGAHSPRVLDMYSAKEFKPPVQENKAPVEVQSEKVEVEAEKVEIQPEKVDAEPVSTIIRNIVTLKAASHDDNAEFPFYQEFCTNNSAKKVKNVYPWSPIDRKIIRVLDAENQPAAGISIKYLDISGDVLFTTETPSSGELNIFPDFDKLFTKTVQLEVGGVVNMAPEINRNDGTITAVLPFASVTPRQICVQLSFVMDATGSMNDEIAQLQNVIYTVNERLRSFPGNPAVELSLAAYRDKTDRVSLVGHPFTGSVDTFQTWINDLDAYGGGDKPEDVEGGLSYALDSITWKSGSVKVMFMVGDAAPHTKKARSDNYLELARSARNRGIKIFPIGASGLDLPGEVAFRQIALRSGGEFIFLHYGEEGESEGAASKKDIGKVSHHTGENYEARTLDEIIVDVVKRELAYRNKEVASKALVAQPRYDTELLNKRLMSLLQLVLKKEIPLSGKAITLTPFVASDSTLNEVGQYLWESALIEAGKLVPVNLVERARLEAIIQEHALIQSGVIDPAYEDKIGKLTGSDYVMFTKLSYIGLRPVCHARLVDCATGTIVSAARVPL
ncbi:MAG: VWA domain-containing protein [Fibrobacteres bacterium]|nr:VWA domain-containing protein [Fibrobacterota bacterium]